MMAPELDWLVCERLQALGKLFVVLCLAKATCRGKRAKFSFVEEVF